MTWIASSLWELLGVRKKPKKPKKNPRPAEGSAVATKSINRMQEKYDAVVVDMKKQYGIRIRKWRSSTTGCAWEVHYDSGKIVRLVESPYPRGPMSCAVFLHEIGHHAIGFGRYRPRCLEEYHAWKWSLEMMHERGLNVTAAVEKRFAESMRYALSKALRRGLKRIPEELLPYLPPPYKVQK